MRHRFLLFDYPPAWSYDVAEAPMVGRTFGQYPLIAALLAAVALPATPVAAQIVLPGPTEPTAPAPPVAAPDGRPPALERITRALATTPSPDTPRLRLLDLREYVFVFGERPEISLLGESGLAGGPAPSASPTHAEMTGITTPQRFNQAMGTDAVGFATAALSRLAIPAIGKLVDWLTGDDGETRLPSYTVYSDTFVVEPAQSDRPPDGRPLLFHRLDGQRVALHARVLHPPTPGVVIAIDGEELGLFDRDVSDVGIPEELLLPGRIGNLHSLRVTPAPGTARQDPLTVEVTVVVHAPSEP